jgi:hypothetical protein
VLTPVGYRCKECGKERSVTRSLDLKQLVPGLIVGFGLPFGAGYVATVVPLGLFLIFIGAIVGSAVGQLLRRVIGMKSSPLLAVVSVAGYFLGALVTPIYEVVKLGGNLAPLAAAFTWPWPLIFAGVAAASTAVQLK